MLKQYDFSVIHFNNGLHGWGYTEDQYLDGLVKTVATVKEHAADAKFIWATTTPVRENSDLKTFAERTDRVKERNKLASQIMKEQNNRYAATVDHLEQLVRYRYGEACPSINLPTRQSFH